MSAGLHLVTPTLEKPLERAFLQHSTPLLRDALSIPVSTVQLLLKAVYGSW